MVFHPEVVSILILYPFWFLKFTNFILAIVRGGNIGRQFVRDQRKCLTTTNSTYYTSPSVSGYLHVLPHSEEAKAFQTGMTPIVTMFFNLPDQPSHASFLATPEMHLSCVQTYPTEKQQSQINSAHTHRKFTPLFIGCLTTLAVTAILM